VAWVIYRIQTQTGINPLDPRRDGKRGGEKGDDGRREKKTIYDRRKDQHITFLLHYIQVDSVRHVNIS